MPTFKVEVRWNARRASCVCPISRRRHTAPVGVALFLPHEQNPIDWDVVLTRGSPGTVAKFTRLRREMTDAIGFMSRAGRPYNPCITIDLTLPD